MLKNIILGLFFLLVEINNVYAQSYSLLDYHAFGTSSINQTIDAVYDASGNYYITGRFYGTFDVDPSPNVYNITSNGVSDIFIAKFNTDHSIAWAKSFGSTGDDLGYSIDVDASGNVYFTGHFSGTMDVDPSASTLNISSNGGLDAFLIKLNSIGAYLNHAHWGSSAEDVARKVKVDASGNVYIGGWGQGTIDFDPGVGIVTHTSYSVNYDLFVVKLNSAFEHQWSAQIGSSDNSILHMSCQGMDVNAAGDVIITANIGAPSIATIDFDPGVGTNSSTVSNYDMCFLKLDASGNYVTHGVLGGSGADYVKEVIFDDSDNFYITGYYNSMMDPDPSANTVNLSASSGGREGAVLKYDVNGNYIWGVPFKGEGFDLKLVGNQLIFTGNLTGGGQLFGSDNYPNGVPIIVLNDVDGSYVMGSYIQMSGTAVAWTIDVDPISGNILVGGQIGANSSLDFDPYTPVQQYTSGATVTSLFWGVYELCNTPKPYIGNNGMIICAGSCVNLNADIPGGTWNIINGGSGGIISPNNNEQNIQYCDGDIDPFTYLSYIIPNYRNCPDVGDTILLNTAPNPAINSQPSSININSGDAATFGVSASNVDTYQWKKDGSDIAGETNSSLFIPSAQLENEGTYTVELTSMFCGSILSNEAILTILPCTPSTSTQTMTVEGSYLLPDGNYVTSSGQYIATIPTYDFSCDSIITYNLTVTSAPVTDFYQISNTPFANVILGHTAFADIDGDGDQDVLITGRYGTCETNCSTQLAKLYTNNGGGTYTEVIGTPFEPVEYGYVAFSDVDGDGDQDVLLTGNNLTTRFAKLYINDGSGTFTEKTGTPFVGVNTSTVTFGDVDGDKDQDVLITGYSDAAQRTAKLYTNDGIGNFTEVIGTPFDGVQDAGNLPFADVDGDGDLDVLITGFNNSNQQIAKLYINNGTGTFTEELGTPFEGSRIGSLNFADFDNDGDQDVLITGQNSLAEIKATLYMNNGSGVFSNVLGTPFINMWFGDVDVADFDNDGDQDILITGEITGNLSTPVHSVKLYTNGGIGNFTEVTGVPFEPVYHSSVEFADIDGDGDQDVLITGRGTANVPVTILYRNGPKCEVTSNISVTACGIYNAPSGKNYTTTQIFKDTIPTFNGVCDSIITIDLTIIPALDPIFITPSIEANELCEGDELELSVDITFGDGFEWKRVGDNTVLSSASNLVISSILPFDAGSYYVNVLSSQCSNLQSDTLVYLVNSRPNLPSVIDETFCLNFSPNPLQATSDANHTINWWGLDAEGGTSTGTSAPTPSTLAAGTFTYYVSQIDDITSCESERESLFVYVINLNTPSVSNVDYCLNEVTNSLEAIASPGFVLQWYGTNSTGGTANGTAPKPKSSKVGETSYYVSQKLSDNPTCESARKALIVTVNDTPNVPNVLDTIICLNAKGIELPVEALDNHSLVWYGEDAVGGTASYIRLVPDATVVGSSTYFVGQENDATGCQSMRTPILVEVQDNGCENDPIALVGVGPEIVNIGSNYTYEVYVNEASYDVSELTYQWFYSGTAVNLDSISPSVRNVYYYNDATEGELYCVVYGFSAIPDTLKWDIQLIENNYYDFLEPLKCPVVKANLVETYIDEVKFLNTNFANENSGRSNSGYGDYTALYPEPPLYYWGEVMHLQIVSKSEKASENFFGVFIDFNNNGSFGDEGDFVDYSEARKEPVYTSTRIKLPDTASFLGTAVCRVRVLVTPEKAIDVNDTCITSNFKGEVEDYLIRVEYNNKLTTNNLLTPNNDTKNDVFVVHGLVPGELNRLSVFNRTGKLVYVKDGYDNTWDGFDQDNVPLPNGTYYYVIVTDNTRIKGFVELIRD